MKTLMIAALLIGSITAMASTNYYFGDVNFSSPDGKQSYGKTISLIKRTVVPSMSKIIEIAVQPSRNPKGKADKYITTLSRVGGSNKFLVRDEGNTFSGYMDFKGSEWKWNNWKYNISMKSGEKIAGEGRLDQEGLKTKKLFIGKDGKPTMQIKENLKSISETEYKKQYDQLMSN
jgi:hypothetical protein